MTFANPTLLPSDLNDRIIIRLDDPRDDIDFVTLHNFLYYMHTGSVNLIFEQDKIPALIHPKGFPKKADAFDLYRIADRCLVEGLKDYCYRFIEATTTASNVAERLSHLRCEHDDALRNLLHKIACTFDCVPSVPPHSPDGIESKKKRKLEV